MTKGRLDSQTDIFVGDSEMAQLMRAHDWASTALGPAEAWPNALKVAVRLLLTSRFEMWLGWGPDINFLYNDAYRPTLGDKHPRSLGMPTKVLWAEIWDDIRDRLRRVYERGEASWDRGLLLLLERSGFPEETYHTFSYSPLIDDDGKVGGVFCAVTEETTRVITQRRMDTLRRQAAALASADSRMSVVAAVERELPQNLADLPFALAYLFTEDGDAVLSAASGVQGGTRWAPERLPIENDIWNLSGIWRGHESYVVDVSAREGLPTGAWAIPRAAFGSSR